MERHREKMAIYVPKRPQKEEPCRQLDLRILASRSARKSIPVVEAASLWSISMALNNVTAKT